MGLTPTSVNPRSSSARRNIFSCDALTGDVLLAPGFPPASTARDNGISDGAVIAVSEGACAILVSRGRVFDLCAEAGAYAYDSASLPEPLPGELGAEAVKDLYPCPPDRSGHRLWYVNLRPVSPLPFRSARGIPFPIRLPEEKLDLDILLFFEGAFRYQICDPARFFTDIAGPVTEPYDSRELNELLSREAETALAPVLARLGAARAVFSSRGAFCQAIAEGVKAQLEDHWRDKRGIRLTEVTIRNVSADDSSARYFHRWLALGEQAAPRPAEEGAPKRWYCPDCGAESTGNFCPQCGRRKP